MPKVLEEDENVAVLPSKFSMLDRSVLIPTMSDKYNVDVCGKMQKHNSTESMCRDEVYTESDKDVGMEQIKGQNFRWKIIIKHHGMYHTYD